MGTFQIIALISNLTQSLVDIELKYDSETEKPMYRERGADTWLPFLTDVEWEYVGQKYGSDAYTVTGEGGTIFYVEQWFSGVRTINIAVVPMLTKRSFQLSWDGGESGMPSGNGILYINKYGNVGFTFVNSYPAFTTKVWKSKVPVVRPS